MLKSVIYPPVWNTGHIFNFYLLLSPSQRVYLLAKTFFQASCRDILDYIRMGLPLISFISRLDNFVATNPNLNHQFLLNDVATFKWRGAGGRTVAKTLQYDLPVVASFAPDIAILQLGTNDLSRLDPLVVGSSIEELVTILHDTYNVKVHLTPNFFFREN